MTLIDRKSYHQQVQDSLAHFRVTALLGPRQCGKNYTKRRTSVHRLESFGKVTA